MLTSHLPVGTAQTLRNGKGGQRASPMAKKCQLTIYGVPLRLHTHTITTHTTKISPASPNSLHRQPWWAKDWGRQATEMYACPPAKGPQEELQNSANLPSMGIRCPARASAWRHKGGPSTQLPPADQTGPLQKAEGGVCGDRRHQVPPGSGHSREGRSPNPQRRSSERLGLSAKCQTHSGE